MAKTPSKKLKAAAGAAKHHADVRKVLHVGCGPRLENAAQLPPQFQGTEWEEVRLDIDPKTKPDIVADMLDMKDVSNASMDAVYSSHNVEHLYAHEIPKAFKEFFRVLKPGGVLLMATPDTQSVAAYVAEGMLEEPLYDSPSGPICPIDILYGWRKAIAEGNTFMAHKSGMTAKSLAQHLLQCGFSNLLVQREWVNLWATAYKLPENHPQRQMAARIVNAKLTGSKGQRLPFWYERKLRIEENPE
ncbi:MAG: class I SAM-dependent methyltransferase, partial [Rickettsiales bacterium]